MRPLARRTPRAAWLLGVVGAVLGLAACAVADPDATAPRPGLQDRLGADFGNAVSHNAAQQIVDPAPATARAGAPAMDGARAAGALERYRNGTVIVPQAIETSGFGEGTR